MKHSIKKYILGLTLLFIPFFVHAQTANYWYPVSNNLQPIINIYGLQIPKLGSTGNPCVSIANISGLFATTTCGSSGGGSTTPAGVSTYVQFNSNNLFDATSSFTFSSSTGLFSFPYFVATSTATSTMNGAFFIGNFKGPLTGQIIDRSTGAFAPLVVQRNANTSAGTNDGIIFTDQVGNLEAGIGTEGAATNDLQLVAGAGIEIYTGQPMTTLTNLTHQNFKFTSTGSLGIGTTSPTQKLAVVGDVFFTGNATTTNLTATGTIMQTSNGTSTFVGAIVSPCFATTTNGSCIVPGSGGGTTSAAGVSTYLQFNSNGKFDANSNLTYSSSTNILTLNGTMTLNDGNAGVDIGNAYTGGSIGGVVIGNSVVCPFGMDTSVCIGSGITGNLATDNMVMIGNTLISGNGMQQDGAIGYSDTFLDSSQQNMNQYIFGSNDSLQGDAMNMILGTADSISGICDDDLILGYNENTSQCDNLIIGLGDGNEIRQLGGKTSIGTTSFLSYLTVNGTVSAPCFSSVSATSTCLAGSQWTTSGSNIYYNTGKVLIGTTTGSAPLTIAASSTQASTTPAFQIGSSTILANILQNGTTEIGTSTNCATLCVQGINTGNIMQLYSISGTVEGTLINNGNFTVGGAIFPSNQSSSQFSSALLELSATNAVIENVSTNANTALNIEGNNSVSGGGIIFKSSTANTSNDFIKFILGNNGSIQAGGFIDATNTVSFDVGSVTSTSSTAYIQGTSTSPTKDIFDVASSTASTTFSITSSGHVVYGGQSPTVSGGTSAMVQPSNDNAGQIAVAGVALTSVTMTFSQPWKTAPVCVESDNQTAITGDVTSISTTTVVFGFGTGGVTTATIWYECMGVQ